MISIQWHVTFTDIIGKIIYHELHYYKNTDGAEIALWLFTYHADNLLTCFL